MQNNTQTLTYDGLVDFHEIFQILLIGKKLIIAVTSVFFLGSLLHAVKLPNEYSSTAVLAPVNQDGEALAGMSRIGSLASLAGVNVGLKGNADSRVAQEIIKSWGFAEDFIQKYGLQVELMAVSGWDKQSNSLIINTDIYDDENQKWLLEDAFGKQREPTSWELYKRFSKMLTISEESDSGLVSLSISYYSPHLAKQWVDLIYKEINTHMQQRKLSKVNSNIEFLQIQIAKTSISQMQNVFYLIIEEQMKSKMIAEASPEHTYVLVSRSMVAEKESGPVRAVYVVAATSLGFILSLVLVLFRHKMTGLRNQSSSQT